MNSVAMKFRLSLALALILLLMLTGCGGHQGMGNHDGSAHGGSAQGDSEHSEDMDHSEMSERQSEVALLGKMVMPFELDATTHIFEPIDNGGRQQVLVDDPADTENLELIRSHLAEEAKKFAQGDFHDPQMIHGEAMAGMHAMVMGIGQITIEYSEVPDGGQILYTTDDAQLVEAIHAWFEAQLADHGQHAQGHP